MSFIMLGIVVYQRES